MTNWDIFYTAYKKAPADIKHIIDSEVIGAALAKLSQEQILSEDKVSIVLYVYSLTVLQVYTPEQFIIELTKLDIHNGLTIFQKMQAYTKPDTAQQTSTPTTPVTPTLHNPAANPPTNPVTSTEPTTAAVPPVRTMSHDMATIQPNPTVPTPAPDTVAPHNLPTEPVAQTHPASTLTHTEPTYQTTQDAILRPHTNTPTTIDPDEARWNSAT